MKKTIVLLFLLLAVPCRADLIMVYPDGSGDYPTIQAAVDAALADDTAIVAEGTYSENISAASDITINFTGTTTINGQVTTALATDIIADADLTIISDANITLDGPVTVAGMLGLYADGDIVISNTVQASEVEMIAGGSVYLDAAAVITSVLAEIYAGADVTITDLVNGGYLNVHAQGNITVDGYAAGNVIFIGPTLGILFADAGQDQTVFAWIDDMAQVQLDGSASGGYVDEFEYYWSWELAGEFYEANGVDPVIELPVGEHTIELVINDGIVYSEPNEVVITVIESIEAAVLVRPGVLNRKSAKGKMIARMHLPADITVDMFDSRQKLMLYPGGVEALSQRVFRPRGPAGSDTGITILAFFNKGDVLDAIDDNGKVDIDIVGKLKSGQYIYSKDNIRIIQPRRLNLKARRRP